MYPIVWFIILLQLFTFIFLLNIIPSLLLALFDDSGNFATDLLDDDENNRDEGMVEEV